MAEPFKNLLNAELIGSAAAHLRRAWRGFPQQRFIALASDGLDGLEMKARAMQIAQALLTTLPEDFERAAGIVEAALAPPFDGEDLSALRSGPAGLAGWVVWPLGEWVVRRGLAQPQRALLALRELTMRHSAEWAVRPFIVEHPKLVFAHFERWTADPNVHVRRWVSEGSRPRLPWGLQLKALMADPSPTLPLLRALQDDSSGYVRRSVANHLNDIAKDHPDLLLRWLHEHLPHAGAERRRLLEHASRGLIKAGDAAVLRAWGLARGLKGHATLRLAPRRVRIGQALRLAISVHSAARATQPLIVDYAVHHVKAGGHTTPKVFKGWKIDLAAGETRELAKAHSMREVTTRRYHPGQHRIELMVNGEPIAEAGFELVNG